MTISPNERLDTNPHIVGSPKFLFQIPSNCRLNRSRGYIILRFWVFGGAANRRPFWSAANLHTPQVYSSRLQIRWITDIPQAFRHASEWVKFIIPSPIYKNETIHAKASSQDTFLKLNKKPQELHNLYSLTFISSMWSEPRDVGSDHWFCSSHRAQKGKKTHGGTLVLRSFFAWLVDFTKLFKRSCPPLKHPFFW